MTHRDMPAAGSFLAQVLAKVAQRTGSAAPLAPVWREVVGEQIARHATPALLEGGVLTVDVDGPLWRAELEGRHDQLLVRLSDRLGAAIVRKLSFRTP